MIDLQWNKEFAEEQSGGDPELLAELLALFIDSSRSDLQKIRDGLAAGDGNAVADAAHSIKGAAASLGVEGLRHEAHAIEKQGRAARLVDIDLGAIEAMIEQLSSLTL